MTHRQAIDPPARLWDVPRREAAATIGYCDLVLNAIRCDRDHATDEILGALDVVALLDVLVGLRGAFRRRRGRPRRSVARAGILLKEYRTLRRVGTASGRRIRELREAVADDDRFRRVARGLFPELSNSEICIAYFLDRMQNGADVIPDELAVWVGAVMEDADDELARIHAGAGARFKPPIQEASS